MGIPIDEIWLRWMVTNAVHTFGGWVENKLAERDRNGKPLHRIERLLDVPIQPKKVSLSQLQMMGILKDTQG